MNGLRISRTVLLSIALAFGILGLLLPLAHSITTYGGTMVVEETYTLWGVERTLEGSGTSPLGALDQGWNDGRMDNTGGITYLRMAIPLVLVGIVLTAVALLLTVLPATGNNRSGGITSAAALAILVVGFVLHGWGLILRNEQFFDAWRPEAVLGAYLIVLAAILLLIAALQGMVSHRVIERTVSDRVVVETGHTAGDLTRLRYFQCNSCGKVETVSGNAKPVCTVCGNASPV